MNFEKALEHHVALFLAKLSGVKSVITVKQLCVEEKGWFETQYQNGNTRAAHMTKYRKGIALMGADRSFPNAAMYEQETANGAVRQHTALKWMNYGSEFHQQVHQSAGSAANYEDYCCVDANGQPLAAG